MIKDMEIGEVREVDGLRLKAAEDGHCAACHFDCNGCGSEPRLGACNPINRDDGKSIIFQLTTDEVTK